MRQLVRLLEYLVTAPVAIGARPAAAGDGVAIPDSWRSAGFTFPDIAVFIDGDQAMAINAIGTEGVELWGYALSQWWLIGSLHDGVAIQIAGDGQGFTQELHDVGDYQRLAVAGTPTVGAATVKFCPMERHTY